MATLPTQPDILEIPFCNNGDKSPIPTNPLFGRASLSDGFPVETGMDLSEGGVPPNRLDFNGILNLLSQFAYWLQSGGIPTWNEKLDYTPPARICAKDGKFYKCVANSGPSVDSVGPKDPTLDVEKNYWKLDGLDDDAGSTPPGIIVGEMKLLPFREEELPKGWYVMKGQNYPLTSPQGTVLNAFSDTFKTDWGITTKEIEGAQSINMPNIFADDNTGAMFVPADGTTLQVGQIQEDAGRNLTGNFNIYSGVGFSGGSGGAMYFGGSVPYCFSFTPSGHLGNTLFIDASRSWGGNHTGNRFKVYGRGLTASMYLGV